MEVKSLIIYINAILEKPSLPTDYSPVMVSFIKNALMHYDEALYERFYNKNNFSEKNFCFAVRLDNPVFNKNKITMESENVKIIFSIADFSDGIDFYNSFLKQRKKAFPFPDGNNISIEKVSVSNHKTITSNEILIKMQSPLIIRQHENNKDFYLSHTSEDFSKYTSMSTVCMLKRLFDIDITPEEIQIYPYNAKKTVVNTFGSKITGNVGSFILKSSPEILNLLSQTGIGSRRSQGFGCFEVIMEVK